MFNRLFNKPQEKTVRHEKPHSGFFSTHALERGASIIKAGDVVAALAATLPRGSTPGAQDDSCDESSLKMNAGATNIPEALAMWYASQTFIGHQFCAILSQHWLIDKACTMPGRDAIRNGFDIVTLDGESIDPAVGRLLNRYDRAMKLRWNLEQFIRMGRIFGVRIVLFKVESTDPEYYEKPFNIDGVTPDSYKGIVQVDPYWCAPMLDGNAASQPDTMHFYEPTFWMINGRRYHRSHLIVYRHSDLPDILKPQYQYGGIPVPQQIMERVYGSERTANEAPQLVQTKRMNVFLTDMEQFSAKGDAAIDALNTWVYYRDNYGVKLGDKEGDEFQQFDTSLADLDAVIMTQYQLVAAAANVPATKLLGTTPKGFNSTGEYEEASYHEELETIQEHDLTPLIERHHALVMRAYVVPQLGCEPFETTAQWEPLDSPTAKELADTNLVRAQTGAALIASGALSSEDERQRIAMDSASGYAGISGNEHDDSLTDNDESD